MKSIDLTWIDSAMAGTMPTTPFLLIVANSPAPTTCLNQLIQSAQQVLAADGAGDVVRAHTSNFRLIGDFDSVSVATGEAMGSTYKDDDTYTTDVEKCINHAINHFPGVQIMVYNPFGGRMDHTLYNVYLAGKYTDVIFVNDNNVTFAVSGKMEILRNGKSEHFGYFPLEKCHVKTNGFIWDIDEEVSWNGLVSACNLAKDDVLEVETDGKLFFICSW